MLSKLFVIHNTGPSPSFFYVLAICDLQLQLRVLHIVYDTVDSVCL
jgi:hypothetical protein